MHEKPISFFSLCCLLNQIAVLTTTRRQFFFPALTSMIFKMSLYILARAHWSSLFTPVRIPCDRAAPTPLSYTSSKIDLDMLKNLDIDALLFDFNLFRIFCQTQSWIYCVLTFIYCLYYNYIFIGARTQERTSKRYIWWKRGGVSATSVTFRYPFSKVSPRIPF